ncbi:DNA helicase [Tanacetum coccineum]
MRLLRPGLSEDEQKHSETFMKWLLNVGNDELGEPNEEDNDDSSWINIHHEHCVTADKEGMLELIDFIYDKETLKTPTTTTLYEKAIVCPKNDYTNVINVKILSTIEGESKTYLSNDEALPLGMETSETEMFYPMEYLNTMKFPGFSPHELELKVGSPITLL